MVAHSRMTSFWNQKITLILELLRCPHIKTCASFYGYESSSCCWGCLKRLLWCLIRWAFIWLIPNITVAFALYRLIFGRCLKWSIHFWILDHFFQTKRSHRLLHIWVFIVNIPTFTLELRQGGSLSAAVKTGR